MKITFDENCQTLSNRLDTQVCSVQNEVKKLEETLHVHSETIGSTSTTLNVLSTQSSGLAQQISAQGKELRSQLRDANSKIKEQTNAMQQSQQTLGVLKEQQTSTAARAGHQASRIQNLESTKREADKKIGSLQFEVKDLTQKQKVLQHGVSDISTQLVSVTRQLSSTVTDVEEVKSSLQTQGNLYRPGSEYIA